MKRSLLISVLAIVAFAVVANAETYYLGTKPKTTNISFASETILESILGNVDECSGSVTMDDKTGSVKMEIPVTSMKTGLDFRDKHMLDVEWLDAKTYPNISFESKSTKMVGDGKWEVTGDFTVHGKKVVKTVTVEATPVPDNKASVLGPGKWMRFRTDFTVKLSEHDIKIEKIAEGKVNNEWKIKVSLFGTTTALESK